MYKTTKLNLIRASALKISSFVLFYAIKILTMNMQLTAQSLHIPCVHTRNMLQLYMIDKVKGMNAWDME